MSGVAYNLSFTLVILTRASISVDMIVMSAFFIMILIPVAVTVYFLLYAMMTVLFMGFNAAVIAADLPKYATSLLIFNKIWKVATVIFLWSLLCIGASVILHLAIWVVYRFILPPINVLGVPVGLIIRKTVTPFPEAKKFYVIGLWDDIFRGRIYHGVSTFLRRNVLFYYIKLCDWLGINVSEELREDHEKQMDLAQKDSVEDNMIRSYQTNNALASSLSSIKIDPDMKRIDDDYKTCVSSNVSSDTRVRDMDKIRIQCKAASIGNVTSEQIMSQVLRAGKDKNRVIESTEEDMVKAIDRANEDIISSTDKVAETIAV